jgi:hypothetical protein
MAALEQKLPSITNAAGASTSHHLDSEATFRKLWKHSTEDNNLTLYGFRRFKTSHLLNLRYLEEEISRLDYDIYQAGLRSGCRLGERNRLGLRYSKLDTEFTQAAGGISTEMILKLRGLLKDYGELPTQTDHL